MAVASPQYEVSHAVPSPDAGTRHASATGRQHTGATIAACMILVTCGATRYWLDRGYVPTPPADAPARNAGVIDSRINPNTAPWQELTVLPRIGEVTAKKIIDYRTQWRRDHPDTPAFTKPEDLERIHGIGPKTVDRLRGRVKFN